MNEVRYELWNQFSTRILSGFWYEFGNEFRNEFYNRLLFNLHNFMILLLHFYHHYFSSRHFIMIVSFFLIIFVIIRIYCLFLGDLVGDSGFLLVDRLLI